MVRVRLVDGQQPLLARGVCGGAVRRGGEARDDGLAAAGVVDVEGARGLVVRRQREAQEPHLAAAGVDAVREVEPERRLARAGVDAPDATGLFRDVPVALGVLVKAGHALEAEVAEDALDVDVGQAGGGRIGR